MNTQQLTKRLKREVQANPAKAGVLGLLLVVALYFWAPLVMKWVKPGEQPELITAEVASVEPVATAAATAANPSQPPQVTEHWQALVSHMESHPHMQPVKIKRSTRDPFVRLAPPDLVADAASEAAAAEETPTTPRELGLVLNSTVVGPTRRTAIVNGKVYREGRTLRAADGLEFVVTQVQPRKVVLERAGQQYVLAIAAPAMLEGDE